MREVWPCVGATVADGARATSKLWTNELRSKFCSSNTKRFLEWNPGDWLRTTFQVCVHFSTLSTEAYNCRIRRSGSRRHCSATTMTFFKITLIRSSIGLPRRTQGVLAALGLRKRMRTVFHPVTPDIAGQIMKVKELVAVSEVEQALTQQELRALRKPDPGYYVETPVSQQTES